MSTSMLDNKIHHKWPVVSILCCCLIFGVGLFARHHRTTRSSGTVTPRSIPKKQDTAAGNSQTRAVPKYHAVVIGINDYAHHSGSGWNDLQTARPDAEAVADLLESEYAFSVTRLFDSDATRGAIIATLDALSSLTKDDAALMYFAGHGFYDKTLGEGYWIPSDARRKTPERYAKEDWVWNSTITKIIGASMARHILVIADSCYAGSLFRGDEHRNVQNNLDWYRRALAKPSRYLIASGDLEPVLDSGAQHSVFAQQILNFLGHSDKDVFSAGDLGMALRQKVSSLTGQMVQMGPLAVSGHAGGEFVFVKKDTATDLAMATRADRRTLTQTRDSRKPAASVETATADQHRLFRDAALLGKHGAVNAASALLASALAEQGDVRLRQAVIAYLDQSRKVKARSDLRTLIDQLERRKGITTRRRDKTATQSSATPRIVACLGPEPSPGSGADAESLALLYRICLKTELQRLDRVLVVEREAIEQVLQEINMGASELADVRIRTAIGKLLPAGMLLLGDIFTTEEKDSIYMRVVDTETTRIVASVSATRKGNTMVETCEKLAAQIVAKIVRYKPLTAQVLELKNKNLRAGVGRFHGARKGMGFMIVERVPSNKKRPSEFREHILGKAHIVVLGEETSDFVADWTKEATRKSLRSIWVREQGM